jgi:hypothetical protein
MDSRVTIENDEQIISQLQMLDRTTQKKTVRTATNEAGKAVFETTRRNARAIKQTGFTARSLKRTSKSRKGTTTNRIGQAKQRSFKPRKTTRARGRNLSQIQRAGKPVPIHWIERGTVPHVIRAKQGKRLVFQSGRRSKKNKGLVFATRVRSPGMRAKHLLRRSAIQARQPAARAFHNVVKSKING